MKAIQVRCPQCGAILRVDDGDAVTCEYCGTPAHVQRRTRVLERVVAPPRTAPADVRYALQVRTRVSWVVIGGVILFAAGVVLAVTFAIKKGLEGTSPSPRRRISRACSSPPPA